MFKFWIKFFFLNQRIKYLKKPGVKIKILIPTFLALTYNLKYQVKLWDWFDFQFF